MINYPKSITKNEKIEIDKYCNKLTKFFGVQADKIEIVEASSRDEFDKLFGAKTENWLVGETRGNRIIILKKGKLETDSSHKAEEFLQILKHEICHIFIDKLNNKCPAFMSEGLSEFFAGQEKPHKIKAENIEKFFGPDLFFINYDFNKFAKSKGYSISLWVVRGLMDNFSNQVMIELIKIPKKFPDFKNKIEKITGVSYDEYLKIMRSKL